MKQLAMHSYSQACSPSALPNLAASNLYYTLKSFQLARQSASISKVIRFSSVILRLYPLKTTCSLLQLPPSYQVSDVFSIFSLTRPHTHLSKLQGAGRSFRQLPSSPPRHSHQQRHHPEDLPQRPASCSCLTTRCTGCSAAGSSSSSSSSSDRRGWPCSDARPV
jgi:hypothetical protein